MYKMSEITMEETAMNENAMNENVMNENVMNENMMLKMIDEDAMDENTIEKLRIAAEAGNVNAQFVYAYSLIPDDKAALPWFLKAALGGHLEAMRWCVTSYMYGCGTNVNYSEALRWCLAILAHNSNDISTLLDCAEIYHKSETLRDMTKVYEYNKKAAQLIQAPDHIPTEEQTCAILSCAHMCANGIGTKKDLAQARIWSLKYAEASEKLLDFRRGLGYM